MHLLLHISQTLASPILVFFNILPPSNIIQFFYFVAKTANPQKNNHVLKLGKLENKKKKLNFKI
jgi:hypothetical protein